MRWGRLRGESRKGEEPLLMKHSRCLKKTKWVKIKLQAAVGAIKKRPKGRFMETKLIRRTIITVLAVISERERIFVKGIGKNS